MRCQPPALTLNLALPVVLMLALSPAVQAQQRDQLQRDLMAQELTPVTLYRGAGSREAFGAGPLKQVDSQQTLVRSIASRLTSTSGTVTGLTSSPHTAGAFALGVKDGDPGTVNSRGTSEGYVGVTQGKAMSASGFDGLLQRHGGSAQGLNLLLDVMAQANVVVDASQVVNVLSRRFPGIFTSGFQEMMASSLGREAEYLVFGRKPSFNRVHKVRKEQVVQPHASITGAIFNASLSQHLTVQPKPVKKVKPVKPARQVTRAPTTITRPLTRPAVSSSKPRVGLLRRIFGRRKARRSGP